MKVPGWTEAGIIDTVFVLCIDDYGNRSLTGFVPQSHC